jgi:hypothetical protein
MKITESFLASFRKISKEQNFVFSEIDLKVLLNTRYDQSFYRAYNQLETMGLVKRFSRGIYVAPGFNLIEVNRKIAPESYVSFEYVLAKNSLIGTYSSGLLRSVMTTGRARRFRFKDNLIEQLKIKKELYFGFNTIDGYNIATPEKAFIDCLYFYTKGKKYSFDIFSDIDLSMLDRKLMARYLLKYENPKFVAFVKGVLSDD